MAKRWLSEEELERELEETRAVLQDLAEERGILPLWSVRAAADVEDFQGPDSFDFLVRARDRNSVLDFIVPKLKGDLEEVYEFGDDVERCFTFLVTITLLKNDLFEGVVNAERNSWDGELVVGIGGVR